MQVEILKQIEGKLLYGGKAEIAKMAGLQLSDFLKMMAPGGKIKRC